METCQAQPAFLIGVSPVVLKQWAARRGDSKV